MHDIYSGNLDKAQALVDEMNWVAEVTGEASTLTRLSESALAAMRGHEQRAEALMKDTLAEVVALGQGLGLDVINAGRALLYNSLGRYEAALAAALQVFDDPIQTPPIRWALPELIEAAERSGRPDLARAALEQLSQMTQSSGTDYALGVTAAKAALLLDGTAAEDAYREAIERLGRTRMRLDLARAHLLYGEWLRRKGRRVDARDELHNANEMFAAMGSEGFAERAGRELLATGATVRQRTVETRNDLTPQEMQVAILARDGLSNSEIASRLFVGSRTVEWHLRKVFVKLDIRRRGQLSVALQGVRAV
jgi:ATP/maltotriose-dependent transcriptional regulator MalT